MTPYTIQPHELGFTLPVNTAPDDLPQLFAELLGVNDIDHAALRQPKGRNGYTSQYSLHTALGAELVTVCTDGRGSALRNTTHVLVHGLALEDSAHNPLDIDLPHLAAEIIRRGGWGTTAHLAIDDMAGTLPWEQIKDCCAFANYRDRLRTRLCKPSKDLKTGERKENPPVLLTSNSETINLGQPDSDTRICLYQKDRQMQTKFPWLRVEIRLRNRASVTELLRRIAAGEDLGRITAGAIRHNLEFLVDSDHRKDRRPVCRWWSHFLADAEALQLPRKRDANRSPWYVPPSTPERVRRYLQRHMAGRDGDMVRAVVADIASVQAIDF